MPKLGVFSGTELSRCPFQCIVKSGSEPSNPLSARAAYPAANLSGNPCDILQPARSKHNPQIIINLSLEISCDARRV